MYTNVSEMLCGNSPSSMSELVAVSNAAKAGRCGGVAWAAIAMLDSDDWS